MFTKSLTITLLFAFCNLQASSLQENPGSESRRIETHCNEMMSYLGKDPKYVKRFYFAEIPPPASKVAETPLRSTVHTFVVAPTTTAEYSTIFARESGTSSNKKPIPITAAQSDEVATIQVQLKTILKREGVDSQLNEKSVGSAIKDSQASYIILIGHNEEGWFRFLDGSRILLDEIVSSARSDQRVILLSCGSSQRMSKQSAEMAAGVSADLTYAQAFELAARIQKVIESSKGEISLGAVKTQLQKATSDIQFKHEIGYFIMKAACFGGTLILVALVISALDPCHHDKNCN